MALQDISISWEGHDGTDVEAYIRSYLSQIAGKIGYARVSDEKFLSLDGNEYYHLLCYASKDDYDNGEEPLYESEIPISTDRGTSYTARLYASVPTTTPIIAVEKRKLVYLKFHAIQNDNGQVDDYGAPGTLQFQRSVGLSGAWENVGSGTIQSQPQSGTTYSEFDIGQYFSETNPQQIRVRASYVIDDPDTGESKTITSPWLTWSNIIYTKLSIRCNLTFIAALDAELANGQFPLEYGLTGEVDRVLHIVITGGTSTYSTTFNIPGNSYTNILNPWSNSITDSQTFGLLTHGVRTIEAWVTCSDGSGGELSSDHIFNQIMVDAGGDDMPRLLIENLVTNVQNYVPVNPLFTWAIWTRESDTVVDVEFQITDYDGDTYYLNEHYSATRGNSYPQLSTIEIEGIDNQELFAYFKAFVNNTLVYGPTTITVDNSNKFSPTAGATWVLNPKVRNNSSKIGDDSDNTEIINGVTAHFSGFSWVSDINAVQPDGWVISEDNQRVLRIPAGRTVTLDYDWLDSFNNNKESNVTLEIDFKIKNISNEELPIIQMLSPHVGEYIGLKMLPLEGCIYTATKKVASAQDFRWQEDERVHIAINIVSRLVAIADPNANSLSLCRVFINGIINREFIFDIQDNDWKRSGVSPCNIIIGQIASDIDIYGIRIYKDRALNNSNIIDDYISTIPNGNDKLSFRESNKILDNNGMVSYDLCKQKGVNVLVWRGPQPTYHSPASTTGWWEIHVYNDNGDEDLAHSGAICQSSKSIEASRQGTTANTYFYSNIQTKLKDVNKKYEKELANAYVACGLGTSEEAGNLKAKAIAKVLPYNATGTGACPTGIWVEVSKIHSDYTDFNESDNRPGYAFVCDGWIDGNGMYRGAQYQSTDDVPYATKLVGKINYASSMQSHLMGSCRLYNDLHYRIVGPNSLQANATGAIPRVAKYEELFMFFTNPNENLQPEFQGPVTWGAGKMDDPTWGYNKNSMFCMIEGADNNKTLTDMRIPWQSDRIFVSDYDKGKGKIVDEVVGWTYNGVLSLNLDRCKASVREFAINTTGDPNDTHTREIEGPSDAVIGKIRDFVNFIYLHNVRIRYYNGTYNQFRASNEWNSWRDWQVWCNSGDYRYRLLRYDEVDDNWVDAGWDVENEQVTTLFLDQKYSSAVSANSGNWDNINSAVIAAIAEDARQNIDSIINYRSLLFHYAFTIQFLAGTDNCSKNTYYTLDPNTETWFFSQDDMDTIFATDNSGFQNKPYYIDRQNPYADGSNEILYEGGANALFNLCEAMYEGNELRAMMSEVLTNMCDLVSQNDVLPYVDNDDKRTAWGAMWKYFFSTQKRIPAVAYNETARIRYEYPESMGFTSEGRGVHPISQSMGDQLQAEFQFMKRRLVLLASYAEWGDFSTDTAHRIGLSLAKDTLSFNVTRQVSTVEGQDGDMFLFEFKNLVPHQYIWPSGSIGNTIHPLRTRCKPGVNVNFSIGQIEGDTTGTFYGSNFYRSFGNIGDISVRPTMPTTITAKRLVDVTAVPSNIAKPNFRPSQLYLATPLLEILDLHNSSLIKGSLNLSECTRIRHINLTGCNYISEIRFPHTASLTFVALGSGLGELIIEGQPNIGNTAIDENAGFSISSVVNLTSLIIKGSQHINSYIIVNSAKNEGAQLTRIVLHDINWIGVDASVIEWLCNIPNCELTGEIAISNATPVSFELRKKMLEKWENLGTTLTITYTRRTISSIIIGGENYISEIGQYKYSIIPSPANANDFDFIQWSVSWAEAELATLEDVVDVNLFERTGILDVKQVFSTPSAILEISAVIGNKEASYRVGLYYREAEVGDFVFADGSWSDKDNPLKTVIGVCFYSENGDRRMLSVQDTIYAGMRRSAYTNQQYWRIYAWGLANVAASNGGVQNVSIDGYSTVYDLPSNATDGMKDYSSHGLSSNAISDATMRDGNGFKTFSDGAASDIALREVTTETLKLIEPTNYLVERDIVAGTKIPSGRYNTLLIIKHRNKILTETGRAIPIEQNGHDEFNDLLLLMENEKVEGGGSTDNSTFARESFYYPAASLCYSYEILRDVTLKEGETLNPKFGLHKWYLPSAGELLRILWFHSKGYQNVSEGSNAIFAKAYQAGHFAKLQNWRQSNTYDSYWSSTERSGTTAWWFQSVNTNASNTLGEVASFAITPYDYSYYKGLNMQIYARAACAF